MRHAEKVVVVTGASSGIGKACAELLARRGYRVFGAQRHVPQTEPGLPAIEMIALDVTDDASVRDGIAAIYAKTGRIDAVVNNAGTALKGAIEDTSSEEAQAQFETNFFGVLRVCRAVLPIMRAQGGGHIVNISSLAAVVGLPFIGLYGASKCALEGMTESLRLETRRFGIKVVLIEPAEFRSNLAATRGTVRAAATNPAYRDGVARCRTKQEVDGGSVPTPEPVAELVEAILRDPHPRLRYSVGLSSQRLVVPLKRFLPQRLFETVLIRVLRL